MDDRYRRRLLLVVVVALVSIAAALLVIESGVEPVPGHDSARMRMDEGGNGEGGNGAGVTSTKPGAGRAPGVGPGGGPARPGSGGPLRLAGAGRAPDRDPELEQEPQGGFVLGPAEGEPGDQGRSEAGERIIHCAIEGIVRLDGEPQAGVEVQLFGRRSGGEFLVDESGPAKTDRGGRFRFADVTGNDYRLSVTIDGAFARGTWIACQNDGEIIEADVDLERAGVHVTGIVTDRQGSPLAQSSLVARRGDVNVQNHRQALQVPVGSDGRFSFWLPDAAFQIVGAAVGHHGHVLSVPPDRREVELVFRLERLSNLNGIVIGPDGPQADVKVSALTKNSDDSSEVNSTTSLADGRFSVECGPGEASLTAWDGKRWAHRIMPARLEGTDAPEVVLELQPGRTITGRVHLADGKPAPMVELGIHTLPTGIGGVVQADIEGAFEISGLRPGEPVSIFCLRDERPWEERVLKIAPDQDQVDVLFVPPEE